MELTWLIWLGLLALIASLLIFGIINRKRPNPGPAIPSTRNQSVLPSTPEKGHFFLQVHGITYHQNVVRKCRVGDEVSLIPEPENPYDGCAIKVCRLTGEQLGHIPANHSQKMSGELASGWRFRVTIDEIYPIEGGRAGCRLRLGVLRHSDRTEERNRRKAAAALGNREEAGETDTANH